MKIVTWNINGVKARLQGALTYLRETAPDVICLQEIKSIDENFPRLEFEELGYNVATHGQKGFNGVAIMSKHALEDVTPRLPGDEDDVQARYLEATIAVDGTAIRVASIYLPNGNPISTEKFTYKQAWMDRLLSRMDVLRADEMPVVLAGDYNIIPDPQDAKRPEAWTGDALFQPESRNFYRRYLNAGYTDAIRACHPTAGVYTFWDYQAGAFQKDDGIRIDHLLLSPQATDRMQAAGIDRFTRAWEKPSDHVPVWVELNTG